MWGFLQSRAWDYVAIGGSAIGLLAAWSFVIRYQKDAGFTWWKQPDGKPNLFGRFLMIHYVLLSFLFMFVITNRLFSGWWGARALPAILMVMFASHSFIPIRLIKQARRDQKKGAVP